MTAPSTGRTNCRMVRPRVDLPQPDSPTNPRISPWSNENDTPSTALTEPRCRLNKNPFSTGKCVLTFWTSRNFLAELIPASSPFARANRPCRVLGPLPTNGFLLWRSNPKRQDTFPRRKGVLVQAASRLRQGRGRRVVFVAPGRNPRIGGRIRLRQIHPGADHPAIGPARRRRGHSGRPIIDRFARGRIARSAFRLSNGIPGPLRFFESAHDSFRRAGRGDA